MRRSGVACGQFVRHVRRKQLGPGPGCFTGDPPAGSSLPHDPLPPESPGTRDPPTHPLAPAQITALVDVVVGVRGALRGRRRLGADRWRIERDALEREGGAAAIAHEALAPFPVAILVWIRAAAPRVRSEPARTRAHRARTRPHRARIRPHRARTRAAALWIRARSVRSRALLARIRASATRMPSAPARIRAQAERARVVPQNLRGRAARTFFVLFTSDPRVVVCVRAFGGEG